MLGLKRSENRKLQLMGAEARGRQGRQCRIAASSEQRGNLSHAIAVAPQRGRAEEGGGDAKDISTDEIEEAVFSLKNKGERRTIISATFASTTMPASASSGLLPPRPRGVRGPAHRPYSRPGEVAAGSSQAGDRAERELEGVSYQPRAASPPRRERAAAVAQEVVEQKCRTSFPKTR